MLYMYIIVRERVNYSTYHVDSSHKMSIKHDNTLTSELNLLTYVFMCMTQCCLAPVVMGCIQCFFEVVRVAHRPCVIHVALGYYIDFTEFPVLGFLQSVP